MTVVDIIKKTITALLRMKCSVNSKGGWMECMFQTRSRKREWTYERAAGCVRRQTEQRGRVKTYKTRSRRVPTRCVCIKH